MSREKVLDGRMHRWAKRVRMQEAGARNRKKDRDRLAQIIVAAFDNMSTTEQEAIFKQLKAKMKGASK